MREITDHYLNGSADPTRIYAVDEPDHDNGGGAHHDYVVVREFVSEADLAVIEIGFAKYREEREETPLLGMIPFQHGPVKESGHNGVQNEHLLAVVADRLRCFQVGPFACQANAVALEAVDAALHALKGRTADRQERGVEGRNQA